MVRGILQVNQRVSSIIIDDIPTDSYCYHRNVPFYAGIGIKARQQSSMIYENYFKASKIYIIDS